MIKAALSVAGIFEPLEYRLHVVAPSAENLQKLEHVIKNYDIKGL